MKSEGGGAGPQASHLGEALSDIEQALPRFARWMYRTVSGGLGERVLDAGAGIGTHTELLLADGHAVVSVEFDPAFVERMRERFADNPALKVYQGDLGDAAGLAEFESVDGAICLNVLEHVQDDRQALRNIHARVGAGGRLAVLVPAHSRLYNSIDRAIGHHRRYSKRDLLEKLRDTGWTVERCFYFNVFAIPGWFLAGSVLRRTSPGRDLSRLYDFLVPVLSRIERLLVRGRAGLSLIAVCRRSD